MHSRIETAKESNGTTSRSQTGPGSSVTFFSLALTAALAALFTIDHFANADATHNGAAANPTAAYAFGYAAAANAVCQNIDVQALAASASADPSGQVAEDTARGFRDFARKLEAMGSAGACRSVGRLIRIRQ